MGAVSEWPPLTAVAHSPQKLVPTRT